MTPVRRLALVGARLVPVLAPATAAQTSSSSSSLFVFGAAAFSVRPFPVRLSGQLTVDFHGDAASGCASHGLCGYAGTVSWPPPPTGSLVVFTSRVHGRLAYQVQLEPGLTGVPAPSSG